jgi:GNAT superfamily N-acetyltransferase
VPHALAPDPTTGPTPPDPPDAADVTIRRLGMADLDVIRALNERIFDEARVINTFDRDDLLMLVAEDAGGTPVGFKVGYRLHHTIFYSAKGGVLPAYRRRGIARRLLHAMFAHVRAMGYARFTFDTFPNMHPGMTILALREGFEVVKAGYSPPYDDYRIRFEIDLAE